MSFFGVFAQRAPSLDPVYTALLRSVQASAIRKEDKALHVRMKIYVNKDVTAVCWLHCIVESSHINYFLDLDPAEKVNWVMEAHEWFNESGQCTHVFANIKEEEKVMQILTKLMINPPTVRPAHGPGSPSSSGADGHDSIASNTLNVTGMNGLNGLNGHGPSAGASAGAGSGTGAGAALTDRVGSVRHSAGIGGTGIVGATATTTASILPQLPRLLPDPLPAPEASTGSIIPTELPPLLAQSGDTFGYSFDVDDEMMASLNKMTNEQLQSLWSDENARKKFIEAKSVAYQTYIQDLCVPQLEDQVSSLTGAQQDIARIRELQLQVLMNYNDIQDLLASCYSEYHRYTTVLQEKLHPHVLASAFDQEARSHEQMASTVLSRVPDESMILQAFQYRQEQNKCMILRDSIAASTIVVGSGASASTETSAMSSGAMGSANPSVIALAATPLLSVTGTDPFREIAGAATAAAGGGQQLQQLHLHGSTAPHSQHSHHPQHPHHGISSSSSAGVIGTGSGASPAVSAANSAIANGAAGGGASVSVSGISGHRSSITGLHSSASANQLLSHNPSIGATNTTGSGSSPSHPSHVHQQGGSYFSASPATFHHDTSPGSRPHSGTPPPSSNRVTSGSPMVSDHVR